MSEFNIRFSSKFRKQYHKSPKNIQKQTDSRIKLFIDNPYDQILNNHTLVGRFKGCRSINVNGDWRAIYSLDDDLVTFYLLGTHSQLYR